MDKNISKNRRTYKGADKETRVLTLFLSNYKRHIHVREAARLLKISHRTALLAMDSLEKSGVLKYERIGRNKEFFLNYENPLSQQKLTTAEIFRTINIFEKHFIFKKLISELPMLRNAPLLLFGSYAKGEERERSDIDILIVGHGENKKLANEIEYFGKLYKKEFQVQRITEKKFENNLREHDKLLMEILNNHIILNNHSFFVDVFWRFYYGK